MATGRPILVTGAHRSGTTWVGSILAASREVCYIQEPFHPGRRSGACRARFARWFTYVCGENESRFLEPLRDTLCLRYDLLGAARAVRSAADVPRFLLRSAREYARLLAYRALGAPPLVKDPIALFSAEWLASRFGMDVVIVIRHPAGFASSLKRLGWTFPFPDLLDQPLLMRDLLRPFEAELARRAERPGDILDQAALLWRMMHHVIADYRTRHPGWTFVRHEDLSREPVREFEGLFGKLGLGFTKRARDLIA
ncbi:MAG: sulfotransferase, partial [Planctomycetota bacterium]